MAALLSKIGEEDSRPARIGSAWEYHQGKLQDHDYPAERIEEAMAHLPKVAAA